jgi:3-oxoacyl-[acyl-carrier protein] reductase|tara:strand:- start:1504 stop:2205 length:702 start_codon:yes stop_codon:yes gene_type:complete
VSEKPVVVITGTRTGIGKFLAEYYVKKGFYVIGCSRKQVDFELKNYQHFYLDISDEPAVKKMYNQVRKTYGRLDALINNAGIASMNHALLTTIDTVNKVFNTNVVGTFLSCREAAKLMQMNKFGRIINFTTVATPLRLEGEAVYASSKAAVVSITQILARELADMGITVNAIGPVPVKTDLIRAVPREKIESLINRQAIRRYGEFKDIVNVIDFFLKKESNFITGQVIYLGGI